jgi:sporulation protein YlmC with PRC-barrel domain
MGMMNGGSMKKRYLTIILLALAAAMVLSACEAIDDYNRRRGDRDVLIPGTGDDQNNANDRDALENDNGVNTDDRIFIDDNANDNFNGNDNNNDNNNNNNNNNGRGRGRGNDNANDNANDNGAVPVTGEGEFDEDFDRDNLTRVSHLVGSRVVSESGEVVGQVQSVLVHPVSGKIHYLVLDAEEDLDLERDYVLLPWSGIQPQPGRTDDDEPALVLRTTRDALRGSPSYDDDDLNDPDGGDWEESAGGYWQEQGQEGLYLDDDGRRRGYLRLTDDDYRLIDRDGDGIGEISDFLIHMPSGQINNAVVQSGGLFQRGLTVVPYNRLDWSPPNDAFVLTLNENQFERLPRFDNDDDLPANPGLGRGRGRR